MRQYDARNLVIHPGRADDPHTVVEVLPEEAGWETIGFRVCRVTSGERLPLSTGAHETALVVLGGTVDVASDRGRWKALGERPDVFSGLPAALYLPPHTEFAVTARTNAEFALAFVPSNREHPPRRIDPTDITVEIRGGDHATRQINPIIPPGFPCERLVLVEVYTPGGNWSSYPPHKHDVHATNPDGSLLEADLDEIYYYKTDRPDGYALQRVYTAPASPLHRAGFPIDAALIARNDDVVLVPEGYHPVSSPVGYTTYYLNVLAGSAQSLAATDDPAHAWVKDTYRTRDPRVPVYDIRKSTNTGE